MANGWTNPKKAQKFPAPTVAQLLQTVWQVRWQYLSCSRQGGWGQGCGSAAVSPPACLFASFPVLGVLPKFWVQEGQQGLCAMASLINAGLWTTNSSSGRSIAKPPNLSLQRFNLQCVFPSAVTTPWSAQTCSCMKWEAILVSTKGSWK